MPTPTLSDNGVPEPTRSQLLEQRHRVDRLEDELAEARTELYRLIAEACGQVPQHAVAELLGLSRQRVSNLAGRAG